MDDGMLQAREYRIYPLWEGLAIGIISFCALVSTTYFISFYAQEAQLGELSDGLRRQGEVISTLIDADQHKIFRDREQEQGEDYAKAIAPLEKALEADPSTVFLYTVILENDRPYFVLDPTPEGDADNDGVDDKAHIMEEYTDAPDELLMALRNQSHETSEPYTDDWGHFVTSYIPFYDSEGEFVGVLGIDITAEMYQQRTQPIFRATVRTMVASFFIAFMVGSLVWFMRNFAKIINAKRNRLVAVASEDINVPSLGESPK